MRYLMAVLGLLTALAGPIANSQSFTRQPHANELEHSFYPNGTHVLIIWVARYAHPEVWPDLQTAVDASRIHDLFMGRGLPGSDVLSVGLPESADASAIMGAIHAFARTLPPEDPRDGIRHGLRVVVYFAGHGYSRGVQAGPERFIGSHGYADSSVGYLVPPNATDPGRLSSDDLRTMMVPQADFLKAVGSLNASATLVLLDACFSGLGLENLQQDAGTVPPLSPAEPQRVFQVITAGQADRTVPDDNVFSELVAAGLDGAADLNFDGLITGTELGEYLRVRMTEESIRAGRVQQTPLFETYVGPDIQYAAPGENEFVSPQQLPFRAAVNSVSTPAQLRTFRDCALCPSLRIVPRPPGEVGTNRYLAMGVTDVTAEQYEACFRAGGCLHWPKSATDGSGLKPVTDVNRNDALAYTSWLSCMTGKRYRLPANSEWQYFAAADARRLSAGSISRAARAACRGCGSLWDGRTAAPVASFPADDFGLFDVLGNVWQWMGDCSDRDGERACNQMGQVRGGAFTTRLSAVVSLPVGRLASRVRDNNIGFRVARDIATVSAVRMDCQARAGPARSPIDTMRSASK